jgi:hypothetical protein
MHVGPGIRIIPSRTQQQPPLNPAQRAIALRKIEPLHTQSTDSERVNLVRPGPIRTADLLVQIPILYPVEPAAHSSIELKNRHVCDVLVFCVDGLNRFPDAIQSTYPQALIELCIIKMVRGSLEYVNY